MSRQYRDDYTRDSRGGRDRAEPRDPRRDPREAVRDNREPPRGARDPRDTRERPDPYAPRPMDDSMDIDPPRSGGRPESGRERGGMDPRMDARMDARMDGRMDTRMEQPQEAVGYREYRDPRTGAIMRESVPTRPQRRDRDEFEEDPRDARIPRRPMEYESPLDEPRGGARPRFNDYFLPGDGINREVIQHDICRYLGQDATVRPTRHPDGRSGYTITAYRALTTPMISSLKQDSAKFELEQRQRKYRDGQVPYTSSNTIGNRDVLEREDPRRAPYRGNQPMDIDEDDYPTGPISAGAYGDDPYSSGRRGGPPATARHQVPVTTAGYGPEPAFPPGTYAPGSYTLAPSTSNPAYYDSSGPGSREPRAFANLTPDSAARAAQYPPNGGYSANTQAMRQPAATLYVDPRAARSEAVQAGYPSTSGPYQEPPRHRR